MDARYGIVRPILGKSCGWCTARPPIRALRWFILAALPIAKAALRGSLVAAGSSWRTSRMRTNPNAA